MAARKLQTEIDRTLKRVAEGVESFEGLYDKLQQSTNQTQKEKLEADLKTQIKKLQRMRDQIKTWLQSNDIKDKKPLLDNRKLIETQMERFKACEKEMKTKAFSKEGLSAAMRLDPAEKAKNEVSNWLSAQVDELSHQIEASEAELETIAAGGKKKKHGGSKDERASELEHQNERRQWHISRLELLLRLLENGNLEVEQVNDVKDDILYFVETNGEENFDEDEGIYDEFNLDEEEENFGLKDNEDMMSSHDDASTAGDPPIKTPVKEVTRQRLESEEAVKPPAPKEETIPTGPKKTASARKASTDAATAAATAAAVAAAKEKTVPPANFSAVKAVPTGPAPSSATAKPAPAAALLPPIRYAAAAAAAVASTAPSTSPATATAPAQAASPATSFAQSVSQASQSQGTTDASTAPSNPPSAAGTPALENAKVQSLTPSAPVQADASTPAGNGPPGLSSTPATANTGAPTANGPADAGKAVQQSPVPQQAGVSPSPASAPAQQPHINGVPAQQAQQSGVAQAFGAPPGVLPGAAQAQQQPQPQPQQQQAQPLQPQPQLQQPAQQQSPPQQLPVQASQQPADPQQQAAAAQQGQKQPEARLPSSLADLVSSFESAKQKSMRRDANLSQVHKSLESSFLNVPEPLDSDKPKYYVPKNPFPTPSYYPQTPAPIFDNPALYSKFDVDTLFYIFYYQQGTYHQYLAARELKKQSWRFHKQYLTWFQRHSEPQAITDEYEQGVYVYFDWEGSWCQRKKSDFRFEYRWLEDN